MTKVCIGKGLNSIYRNSRPFYMTYIRGGEKSDNKFFATWHEAFEYCKNNNSSWIKYHKNSCLRVNDTVYSAGICESIGNYSDIPTEWELVSE